MTKETAENGSLFIPAADIRLTIKFAVLYGKIVNVDRM